MDCSYIKSNLFAIQEDRLSLAERLETDLHLESCVACSQLVSGFQQTMDVINADKSKEINPFLSTRILERLESVINRQAEKKQSFLLRYLQPVAFTSSLLLAVMIGISLGKTGINRFSDKDPASQDLQSIRSELFISDFTDEDKTLFMNP